MLYEVARSIIQRIFQDKILAGLVIVGFLSIFVGGFGTATDKIKSGPRESRKEVKAGDSSPAAQNNAAKPEKSKGQEAAVSKLEPQVAAQFVGWWMNQSMDFNPHTAAASRQHAAAWILPEVAPNYQAAFWPPEIAEGILSGKIRGSFTPQSVTPIASNPDGSIVVQVQGQLVLQQGPRPAVQQLSTDYLVKREKSGLRIAGLYNRSMVIPGSSVY